MNPSLLLIPDRYKAAKLYSQIPESGAGDLTFARASSATRVNASGLIESVASGVPRLDYTGGGCPSLLLEPQRTNVALNSETFGASVGTTIVLNNTASPDGYVNADKLVEDTSTGIHRSGIAGALGGSVDSSVYSVSFFAKAAGRTRINIFDNNQSANGNTNFDIANGVVIGGTGKIENYGNGWYRCSIFPAKTNSTNFNCHVRLIDSGTNVSYTGDGTSGVFLWGKQVEAGSYPTSYIPTLGSSVTRVEESAVKTGISSLIGATEGTMFVDINFTAKSDNNPAYIQVWNSQTERLGLFYHFNTNLIRPYLVTASGPADFILGFTPTIGERYKMAFAYKANDYAFFINGTQVTIDAPTNVPTAGTAVMVGCLEPTAQPNRQFSEINQALLFTTRLTNAELTTLTTL